MSLSLEKDAIRFAEKGLQIENGNSALNAVVATATSILDKKILMANSIVEIPTTSNKQMAEEFLQTHLGLSVVKCPHDFGETFSQMESPSIFKIEELSLPSVCFHSAFMFEHVGVAEFILDFDLSQSFGSQLGLMFQEGNRPVWDTGEKLLSLDNIAIYFEITTDEFVCCDIYQPLEDTIRILKIKQVYDFLCFSILFPSSIQNIEKFEEGKKIRMSFFEN
eukprot:GHVP01005172.1.p1 GENE.GHVP01005172.1~~GHVP01005172.1.p1  ORF type:complete len:221 (+),score=57.75 GHVP01005172.1:561-1223(+)